MDGWRSAIGKKRTGFANLGKLGGKTVAAGAFESCLQLLCKKDVVRNFAGDYFASAHGVLASEVLHRIQKGITHALP
jgi:hypothetical protein